MKIKTANGDIFDKLSILQIKLEKIKSKEKLSNILIEFNEINLSCVLIMNEILDTEIYEKCVQLRGELKYFNELLWDIEDKIRIKESKREFDEHFINLARNVYKFNDKRSEIKRELNFLTKSYLIEEKSYSDYDSN